MRVVAVAAGFFSPVRLHTVGIVADAIGVTPRHLQRAFMDSGLTPRQFILDQRLAEAARLLSRSRGAEAERIIDIAFSVGFNDASHFTRAFVQKFGCAPSVYRGNAGRTEAG